MKTLFFSLILTGALTFSVQAQQDTHDEARSNPAPAPTPTTAAPAIVNSKPVDASQPVPEDHGEIDQVGEGNSEYSTPAPDAPSATTTTTPPATATTGGTPKPKPAPKPKVIPTRSGDCSGEPWLAHRFLYKRYAGWGFVKPESEKNWSKAKWVLIEEDPMAGQIIPSRHLNKINADQDYEYRFYGDIMPYKGYEPNYDIFVDVFKIRGFELLGKADPIGKLPPVGAGSSRKSKISEGGARTNPFKRR